jgi:endonuclease YncB( thermonuclease family)
VSELGRTDIHGERIRLLDIDTPESRQSCIRPDGSEWRCGQQAAVALALADWIGTRTARCNTTKLDCYGRHLAYCLVGWVDISAWLVSLGWAFPYWDANAKPAGMPPIARRGQASGRAMFRSRRSGGRRTNSRPARIPCGSDFHRLFRRVVIIAPHNGKRCSTVWLMRSAKLH